MELNELIEKLHKESDAHVPEMRKKIITKAKAEGLIELAPSDSAAVRSGSAAALETRKKGWIAGVASALVVGVLCVILALAVLLRGGTTVPPPGGNTGELPITVPGENEREKSEKELGENYAVGVVSTARLMEDYVPRTEAVAKFAALRARAAAVAMPQVDYISDFNGYLNAFGTFFGEELAYSAKVDAFDADKYDNCVSVGGMLANGDPISYNFYYSEYRVIGETAPADGERYYLEGGMDVGTELRRRQLTVIGERTYAADAAAESTLQMYIYPDFDDKTVYGRMQLEYADGGSLTKYVYTVVKGGATVSEAKAYRPADGSAAFVIETKGANGEAVGIFSVGKPAEGSFNVNFTCGETAGSFGAVQTADKKYRYNNVLMGQFTFNLNDDGTCVLTGYDKRTTLPETLTLPDVCGGNRVVEIGRSAFENCKDIKNVTVPDGVTLLGSEAFRSCTQLAEIKLPDGIKNIPSQAFYNCRELKSARLPADLEKIESGSFDNCSALEAITFPGTLKSIGSTFNSCLALKSVDIPASVTEISINAFLDCPELESLAVASGNAVYKSVDNCIIDVKAQTLFLGCKTSIIPADGSVKIIGGSAFYGCAYLKNITIPYGITEIGALAFYRSGLTAMDMPNSVEIVGAQAFGYCYGLSHISLSQELRIIKGSAFGNCGQLSAVHIPASVTEINGNVFAWCGSLESITVADGNPNFESIDNCLFEKGNPAKLLSGCKTSIIPTNFEIKIGEYAFSGSSVENIVIPGNVTTIGPGAFRECYNLQGAEILDGVRIIESQAFSNCGISAISLPESIDMLADGVFSQCYSLQTVELPSSLRSIDPFMFRDCQSLCRVSFRNDVSNLTGIGNDAFGGCRNLKHFPIPQSVSYIAPMAFIDSGITVVNIPYGTPYNEFTVIGDSAFKYCNDLQSVYIGSNIKEIQNQAFYCCGNLETITYAGTVEQWNAVKKGAGWNFEANHYVVICSDGKLDRNGNPVTE